MSEGNWTKKVNTREVEFRREQDGAESGVEAAYLYFAECPNEVVEDLLTFGALTPCNQYGAPIETGYYGEYDEIPEPVDQRNDIVDVEYAGYGMGEYALYTPCMFRKQPRTAWNDYVMPDFILWINVPGVPDPHAALTAVISTEIKIDDSEFEPGEFDEIQANIASKYQVSLFPIYDLEVGAFIPEAVAIFIACSATNVYIPQGVKVECAFTVTLNDGAASKDINFQCSFEEPMS